MNRVTINGVEYESEDGDIVVNNGQITVGGKIVGTDFRGVVEVRVLAGTINTLNSSASVTCGDVTGNVKANGSVRCDSVAGSVTAMGSVSCDDVGGNINATGSVNAGNVQGSVKAQGSIRTYG